MKINCCPECECSCETTKIVKEYNTEKVEISIFIRCEKCQFAIPKEKTLSKAIESWNNTKKPEVLKTNYSCPSCKTGKLSFKNLKRKNVLLVVVSCDECEKMFTQSFKTSERFEDKDGRAIL